MERIRRRQEPPRRSKTPLTRADGRLFEALAVGTGLLGQVTAVSASIMTTAAIYIRTGPGVPETAAEQEALGRQAAADLDLRVVAVMRDGATARRRMAEALMLGAGSRFGAVIVARLPLLGSSLAELLARLSGFAERQIAVVQAAGKRWVDPRRVEIAALLEARADYRREATAIGRARAKAKGIRFGRPPICPNRNERARAALAAGAGVRAAARAAGISPASVIRLRASSAG